MRLSRGDKFFTSPWGKVPRRAFRVLLCEAQNWRCCYCHEPMELVPEGDREAHNRTLRAATIEHVVHRSRGGQNDWYNTVAACAICNSARPSDMDALTYYRLRLEVWEATTRERNLRQRRNQQANRRRRNAAPLDGNAAALSRRYHSGWPPKVRMPPIRSKPLTAYSAAGEPLYTFVPPGD